MDPARNRDNRAALLAVLTKPADGSDDRDLEELLSDLIAPSLEAFVGLSFQYADYSMRCGQTQSGPPSIVSTVKINQAGFTEMMDTEAMFRKWLVQARSSRLLP